MMVILCFSGIARAAIKIGVLAKRGANKAMKEWRPTGQYLTKQLGEKVVIIPLKFSAIEPMVRDGKLDFLLANPAFFVEMEKKYKVRAIATLINSRGGKAFDSFGGVILVKKDSPIETLRDMKGKKFMVVKYSSFGGAHMAWRLLIENGIDPQQDMAAFLEGKKHDNVVLAVKNGVADVGSVRSDTMERMADEGKIVMEEFRIIHPVTDDFPFVHSTRLYPEWPMAALAETDPGAVEKVAKALRAISADSTAAKAAKIMGWKEAADYASVRECLTVIKYGAFAKE
jgi:phosphate/phosphite/phosphonate ABC transporter binding protein